jgi:hypothetical protein
MEKIFISGITVLSIILIVNIVSGFINAKNSSPKNNIIKFSKGYSIIFVMFIVANLILIFICLYYPNGKRIIFDEGSRELGIAIGIFFSIISALMLFFVLNYKVILDVS